MTSKGITVHPGVIDSDYKGEIQIMMSSQILWQFKKGLKSLNYFFYLTFLLTPLMMWWVDLAVQIKNSPFGHHLVSEFARLTINIKINGKRFSGLLDTGSDITIISKHLWPKSWPVQKISCQIAGIS